MGDGSVPADGETADGSTADGTDREHGSGAVAVDPRGDVVLDTTFHTSPETLRKARRAALAASRRAGPSAPPPPDLKAQVRVAYRVSLECLRGQSGYFARLLSDTQFGEARLVADAHSELARGGLDPATAHAGQLPWVAISDDDEATRAAGRERVFEDMLRILHRQPPATARPTMSYVTTLVLTADRFDCVAAVSRCASTALKFKWPVTTGRPMRDDAGRPTDVEQVLRQKVLVSWLLNQPMRLHNSTRELILRGSRRWSLFEDSNADADDGATTAAAWWTLPDGLEEELQRRRERILNTIASVQRHFVALYSSRERQCKLGYDSSAACDSFQLGQLLKFLVAKGLVFLVDFSPASVDGVPDTSAADIEELLATLRQCPSYQVDKHHSNCGPRIRVEPVLDYIHVMLSGTAVSIPLADWARRRADVTWDRAEPDGDGGRGGGPAAGARFAFTRALANDQRLKYEGSMYADRKARSLFTATSWDWTPEW